MLKIYNSLTKNIELFQPLKENHVTMYVCGPTVWNYIHIGNARPVVFFDVVKRYFEYRGYHVKYVSNITDVDDKIVNRAIELNSDEFEISSKYIQAFIKDLHKLGSIEPDLMPKCTGYINEMIAFIQKLIDCGYAYENQGDVYFRVTKLSDYGLLSKQNILDLESGKRIMINDNKENPLDFTLWKKTDIGIKWESPFGEGRPGWHTECVVMINEIFQDKIDIHGGGNDLKFPHHENEIAQSLALYNHSLANFFMHVGRLDIDGAKMSKSDGNTIFVNELTEEKLKALRLLLLAHQYRMPINYSAELLDQYSLEYEKLNKAYHYANLQLDLNDYEKEEICIATIEEFIRLMEDDFNTPNVITLLQGLTKEINALGRKNEFVLLAEKKNALKQITSILGIDLNYTKLASEDKKIYQEWLEARNAKNFLKADELRKSLVEKNIL